MAVVETLIFPELITVIDNRPVKFNVKYEKFAPDSIDRLGRHPYYYFLYDIPAVGGKPIVINATSLLQETYFKNDPAKSHFNCVKFGLTQIHKVTNEEKIQFGTHEYEAMRDASKLETMDLRHEILNFIFLINNDLPQQKMQAEDVELNINADSDKIQQWLDNLFDEEFLKRELKDFEPNRFGKGHRGVYTYRLNPQKRSEIETDLDDYCAKGKKEDFNANAKLKMFFSYSSRNRLLAGQIKDEFEIFGIDVFLAHEDVKVSTEWEEKILHELKSCDIFLGLITRHFMESAWTYQEAGNAIANGKKIISLIHGGELSGFLKHYQSVQFSRDKRKSYVLKIIDSILEDTLLRDRLIHGMIHELKTSRKHDDLTRLSMLLKRIDNLNTSQTTLIDQYAIPIEQEVIVKEKLPQATPASMCAALISTEGKSDWKILKHALKKLHSKGKFTSLDVEFDDFDDPKGDARLIQECNIFSQESREKPRISIFDRDNPSRIREVTSNNENYKSWGNNVYSFVIPLPEHRKQTPGISIEFYFHDNEIKTKDEMGRRLFINNEFSPESGRSHKGDFNCLELNKLKQGISIIDRKVFDSANNNVALPKNDFAENIFREKAKFNKFDIKEFEKIFDVIEKILSENNTQKN